MGTTRRTFEDLLVSSLQSMLFVPMGNSTVARPHAHMESRELVLCTR